MVVDSEYHHQGAIKIDSKRAIQETAEATGVLIGKKITDKIASLSKTSTKESANDQTKSNK